MALVALAILLLSCDLPLPSVGATTPSPSVTGGGSGRIIFVSRRTGNDEIMALDVDGTTEPANLTNSPAADTLPAVSADGRRIAFVLQP